MYSISKVFADFFKDKTPLNQHAEVLMDKLQDGHICISLSDEEATKLTTSNYVGSGDHKTPFVLCENHLYLQRYFDYETQIIARIKALIEQSPEKTASIKNQIGSHKEFIYQLFKNEIQEIDWQLIAALNACLSNFAIITGGPGTGKTTTVSKVISILFTINPTMKVALAAPTGKAAMRMKESINNSVGRLVIDETIKTKLQDIVPQTIHRLLGYKKDSPYFKHDASNKLNYDLIIVDEASMIDVPMMAKLLDAIPDSCKIIFLGDKNQLASVEAGSVFSDLCGTLSKANTFSAENIAFLNQFIPDSTEQLTNDYLSSDTHFLNNAIVELQKSMRFNPKEGIGYFSKSVIEGTVLQLDEWKNLPLETRKGVDIYPDLESIKADILKYQQYILEPDMLKALKATGIIRILCATKEGKSGVYQCNTSIETILKEANLLQPKMGFYENQLIMITTNNYALQLFNGDIGIVRPDSETGVLNAYFEDANGIGGIKKIPTSYIKNYDTAFAMTIHKSQGSEFETAIVVLPDNKAQILTRELLYTAITRAKTEAKLVISQDILEYTTLQQVQRSSGITNRIQKIV